MDPVSRRRRGQRSEEPVIPDQDRDFEYQAALSQANPSSFSPSSAFNVEASPGTLEAGVTARGGQPEPEQGLVASPFHSDKVRMEVNLIKTRPTTLDADASKLRAEYDDAALGSSVAQGTSLEPDYSLLGAGDQVFGGPRVARVKAVDSRVEEPQLTPDCSLKPETPLISTQGGDGVVTSSDRLDSAVGPRAVPSDAEPSRIAPEDPRELIPEKEDRLLKLEFLLERALDENKELKPDSNRSRLLRGTAHVRQESYQLHLRPLPWVSIMLMQCRQACMVYR
eukprot:s2272_g6.t1